MKKYLLLLLICLPMALQAQVEAKYLAGAVPEVDGKVTFTTSIKAKGMSQAKIYEAVLNWANKRFQPAEGLNPKVLYAKPKEGRIIAGGEEYIVFNSSFIALDRTRIYYHLIMDCENEKCDLTMTRIHYWYEENVDGGYKYKAEEWITDKEGLNKAKNKLAKVSGKFRQKTIDYKDQMFGEIESLLNGKVIANINNETPSTPKTETVEKPVQKVTVPEKKTEKVVVKETGQEVKTDIPEEAIKNATRITITAGNDEQFEISKECWGGFGELFGKKVAFCLIDTQKTMSNMLMVQSDNYKISFYTTNSNQPVAIILCKKLMAKNIDGKEAQKMSPDCMAGKTYNMYVGEILK